MERGQQKAKMDVKLFGYYPEAHCLTCQSFQTCGGQSHLEDEDNVKKYLLDKYGDSIQVSLVNVFSEDVMGFPEVTASIKKNGLMLPIVMIEGRIVLFGHKATNEAICEAIDSAMAGA
ncbi:hypothetical protein CUJ83_05935 [Methanocella sp. CWC-04]|uniref:Uncharacterized protein n=2 Tax=Methanooceanicella nereidis TaxID=2052831 RepID=A0AAP2W4P1_9EURY|nr:hypothetical protein [Methanocella sp. CWC-04]